MIVVLDKALLERHLRDTIPLARAMDLHVGDNDGYRLALYAPLALWDQLIAEAYAPDNAWPAFIETLRAKGKARLSIESEISGAEGGGVAARQSARYVAMTSP